MQKTARGGISIIQNLWVTGSRFDVFRDSTIDLAQFCNNGLISVYTLGPGLTKLLEH